MDKRVDAKVRYEIGQIDILLDNSAPLISIVRTRKPDFIELSAAGSVLHSFYNGIENIFLIIEKHYRKEITTESWHKDLLKKVQIATDLRKPVISETAGNRLIEYMMFRHFFRHAYGFQLDWNKMKHLVEGIQTVWEEIRDDLYLFISTD